MKMFTCCLSFSSPPFVLFPVFSVIYQLVIQNLLIISLTVSLVYFIISNSPDLVSCVLPINLLHLLSFFTSLYFVPLPACLLLLLFVLLILSFRPTCLLLSYCIAGPLIFSSHYQSDIFTHVFFTLSDCSSSVLLAVELTTPLTND